MSPNETTFTGDVRISALGNPVLFLENKSDLPGQITTLLWQRARGDATHDKAPVVQDDFVSETGGHGWDGTQFVTAVGFTAKVDGPVSANCVPGRWEIKTTGQDGVLRSRVTINCAGAIGLGEPPDYGQEGDVLVSHGPNKPATWEKQKGKDT